MVDYAKIQLDILKDYNKEKKCKNSYMFDISDDTFIYIAINGVYVLAVPRCLWVLDLDKILTHGATSDHSHKFRECRIYEGMIKNISTAKSEKLSFKEMKILKDKITAATFTCKDFDLLINESFFKYVNIDFYNLDENYVFSGTGKIAPLILHDRQYFVGMFLPIKTA